MLQYLVLLLVIVITGCYTRNLLKQHHFSSIGRIQTYDLREEKAYSQISLPAGTHHLRPDAVHFNRVITLE